MTHEIIHGDCIEVMRGMADASVDAVICDPPYDAKTHAGARYGGDGSLKKIDFAVLPDFAWVAEALRITRSWIAAFCSLEMLAGYMGSAGDRYVRGGVWHRTNSAPQFTGDRPAQACDGIAIMHAQGHHMRWNGHGRQAFWQTPIEQGERFHPTQKPICLMEWLLRDFTSPGDTVLDPFMGSGTTGVACVNLGRNFIGIELDPHYCDIARARINAAAMNVQMPLIGEE